MKKILSLLLSCVMLLCLVACGGDNEPVNDPLDGIKPNGDNTQNDENENKDTVQNGNETDGTQNGNDGDNDGGNDGGSDENEPDENRPDASLTKNGFFQGDAAMPMYLYVEWTAVQQRDDTEVTVTAVVYLSHYRLSVKSRSGNTVSVDGQVAHTFSTDPIVCEENVKTLTKLTTCTVKIPRGANESVSVKLSAAWRFSGMLSEEFVDQFSAEATIKLD